MYVQLTYVQCLGNNILCRETIERSQTSSRRITMGIIKVQATHCIIKLKDRRLSRRCNGGQHLQLQMQQLDANILELLRCYLPSVHYLDESKVDMAKTFLYELDVVIIEKFRNSFGIFNDFVIKNRARHGVATF